MAASDEFGTLTKAFSGFGVDENAFISILGKWHPEQRQSFRKGSRDFFIEDQRQFERWDDRHVLQLRHEFLRLKDAIVLWTMHPWERDARLVKEALYKGPQIQYNVLIEIACTTAAEELLGARRAYHSLFDHSIEEDVAFHVHTPEKKLLVALLSAYRYEGPKVNDETAKLEAQTISNAVKDQKDQLLEDDDIIRILSTRSKLHLKAIYKHYKELTGNFLDQDVDEPRIKETIQCLCTPETYFSQILDASLMDNVDEITKESVSRVIVTRADVDMKQIKEEYHTKYGLKLSKRVEDTANGNYKDFLLTLLARSEENN